MRIVIRLVIIIVVVILVDHILLRLLVGHLRWLLLHVPVALVPVNRGLVRPLLLLLWWWSRLTSGEGKRGISYIT